MDIENLAELEEKINTLINAIKQLRAKNVRLLEHTAELQNQLVEQKQVSSEVSELKDQLDKLGDENQSLLKERDVVKSRISALVTELDSIDLSEASNALLSEEK